MLEEAAGTRGECKREKGEGDSIGACNRENGEKKKGKGNGE